MFDHHDYPRLDSTSILITRSQGNKESGLTMSRFVRPSKYRHTYSQQGRKENNYENLKVSLRLQVASSMSMSSSVGFGVVWCGG